MAELQRDIIIFTECGSVCGYGHLTRCIALYDELKRIEIKPVFVLNSDNNVSSILQGRNCIFDSKWYDAPQKYLNKSSLAIVDSYIANLITYEAIAEAAKKVLYIDDTNRLPYPCGIIVNPSIFGENLKYDRKPDQIYLLGDQYIILREAFRVKDNKRRVIKDEIQDILVVMGGADVQNLTPLILDVLENEKYKSINKHVVIGSGFHNVAQIQTMAELNKIKLYYNLDASKMCGLMLECDLAISAAGQTMYELVATETPFLAVQVIDNQANNIQGLIEKKVLSGYCDSTNPYMQSGIFSAWLEAAIIKFSDRTARNMQCDKMRRLELKNGAVRIVEALVGTGICEMNARDDQREICLRKITEADLDMIMKWRMSPEVTEFMFTDPKLTAEGQRKWYEWITNSETCEYWMLQVDSENIGVVGISDIDFRNLRCNWNWYIGELNYRGKGIAQIVQLNVYDYVFEILHLNRLYSEVLAANQRNLRAYEKCGFYAEGILKEHIKKNGEFLDVVICGLTKKKWYEIKHNFEYPRIAIEGYCKG